MNNQDLITRIRVSYTKDQPLRFTGHLDMQRIWERLLRRSKLPIRYSQGYHPRARLNLASALPLGFISEAELLDFWMDEPLSLEKVQESLTSAAPPGLKIRSVKVVDLSEDSLQSQMSASEYIIAFYDPQNGESLQRKVNNLLAKKEILRTRHSKTYDLRPLILEMRTTRLENDEIGLEMLLKAEPGATGRPDEVLDELEFENTEYLVCRTKLIL